MRKALINGRVFDGEELHRGMAVLLEDAAAAALKNRDYYEWTHLQNETLKHRFGIVNDG
jgi:hypothetical protein